MPQLQLPILPGGVAYIMNQLAFKKKDGQITHFNGLAPASKRAAPSQGRRLSFLFQQSVTALWERSLGTVAERPARIPQWDHFFLLERAALVDVETIKLPTHELQELLFRDVAVLVFVHHLHQCSDLSVGPGGREGRGRDGTDGERRRDHNNCLASH
jgi:hypothetical protein